MQPLVPRLASPITTLSVSTITFSDRDSSNDIGFPAPSNALSKATMSDIEENDSNDDDESEIAASDEDPLTRREEIEIVPLTRRGRMDGSATKPRSAEDIRGRNGLIAPQDGNH